MDGEVRAGNLARRASGAPGRSRAVPENFNERHRAQAEIEMTWTNAGLDSGSPRLMMSVGLALDVY